MLAGLVVAFLIHAAVANSTDAARPRKVEERIEMTVVRSPPATSPSTTRPPSPPRPAQMQTPKPAPRVTKAKPQPPPPTPSPNTTAPPAIEASAVPALIVTGISMTSTVESAAIVARVGNTTLGDANKEARVDRKDMKPYVVRDADAAEKHVPRAPMLTREARVVQDFKGRYPRELAQKGIHGAVVALVNVDKRGEIRDVKVASTSGSAALDSLAIAYIKRFRFAAAEVNGEAVDSTLRYTYRFEAYD
jgi:TonB family protein